MEQGRLRRGEKRGGIARRSLLSGAAMAAGCAWAGRARAGDRGDRGSGRFDPSAPADQSLAFRKLAFSTDERIGFWWLHGRRYGLVDGDLTPFWDMHVGSWFRTRGLEDGDYEATTISISVYTDCATGQVVQDFVNPYTGRKVRIGHFPPAPARARYGPSGRRDTPGAAPPGLSAKAAVGPTWVQGDRVYVTADVILAGALVSDPATRVRVNDLTTYAGSVRDVLDPAIAMAPAEQMFSTTTTPGPPGWRWAIDRAASSPAPMAGRCFVTRTCRGSGARSWPGCTRRSPATPSACSAADPLIPSPALVHEVEPTSPSRRTVLLSGLAACGVPSWSRADPVPASTGPGANVVGGLGGWREALVIVPALAPWIETLTTVGGWEVIHHGAANDALNALWSLPPGARTRQVLMRDVGADTGFIRLVEVVGAVQKPIRPDDQAWETGGVSALDIRVVDIEATRAALWRRGWRAPSDPVRYEAYKGIEVIQWAPTSPDGVRLSFIQRIAPPLTGWPELKRWSRAANAAMTVRDMPAAERFFGETLGLTPAGVSHVVGGDGHNVMGLPWSFARTLAIDIHGYRGGAGHDGSVELISIPAAQGRDYAADALPPNLGLAGLRFFVPDLAALQARLAAAGVAPAAPLQVVASPPYGRSRVFAVRAPDGAWLEFLQKAV